VQVKAKDEEGAFLNKRLLVKEIMAFIESKK
jgi:hypothetical protein